MTSETLGGCLFKSNSKKLLRVKFTDICENIVNRVDVPSESGFEKFIGGKHLDPETLKIKRWGSTSDVYAQKLVFKKGHVLFGKRRSYLRKVAYAEFDGVCSAHMLVLKSKPEIVLENFFIFFMQSNLFWKTADKISEGSMSPTIKWKILAKQEFFIPSKEEQSRIAKILWAIEKSIGQVDNAIIKAQRLKKALMQELLSKGIGHTEFKQMELGEIPKDWGLSKIQDACLVVTIGVVNPATPYYTTPDKGIPYFRTQNVRENRLEPTEIYVTKEFNHKHSKSILRENDVLTIQTGFIGTSCLVPKQYEGSNCHSLLITRTNEQILNPVFLCYLLNSALGHRILRKFAQIGERGHLLLRDFRLLRIPLPPITEQHRIASFLSGTDETLVLLNKHRKVMVALKKRVLNDLIR